MRKVMVVEDSPSMRGLIVSLVGQVEGIEVVEAENGFDALRNLPREKVDLVIMDINMPDINGLELLSFVRRSPDYQTTPVIIVSSEAGAQDKQRAQALGVSAYLTKPFSPDELTQTVKNLLGMEP